MLPKKCLAQVLTLVFCVWVSREACGATAAPYYQGKTITVIVGGTPGGLGDLRGRVVMEYLQKRLPGNPTILFKYEPGGGGIAAANTLAHTAARDGLTLARLGSSAFSNAILGTPGVRYRLEDFVCLGSAFAGAPHTLIIRPQLRLDTVEKLKAYTGLRFANRAVGHSSYIIDRLFAFVLGLQDPRWVVGYSSPEVNPALERGEADARTTNLPTFLKETPHWLKQGFTLPVVMRIKGRGAETVPEFPQDRPTLDQFADTKVKQDVLRFRTALEPGTTLFFIHRDVPALALQDLREAFNKIWKDSQFAKEYQRLTAEPADPVTEEDVNRSFQEIPRDPQIIRVYKELIGGGPLPAAR